MTLYEPREDSFLLAKSIEKYVKDKSVLDMCTGTGIIASTALKNGAKSVVAVDINPESISLCKSKGINAINSNLFENIKDKFDVITCNPPYLPEDERENEDSALATTGGKNGDEFILEFLKEAKEHLNKEGIILLLVSSLTPQDRIDSLLSELKFKKEIISEENLEFEKLFVLKISL